MPTRRARNPRGEGARLRGELIEAASRLLDADGGTPSLRAVAREAGVAAPSVYGHFSDLDALLRAVVDRHLSELAAGCLAAANAQAEPTAAVRALALAYVRWGIDHPGAYRVVFEGRAVRLVSDDEHAAFAAGELLLAELTERLGRLPDPPPVPDTRALAVWTAMHGVVSLRIAKPGYSWPPLLSHVVEVLDPLLR